MNTYALTTAARFKSYIKKTTNEDDTLIEILIDVVSDFIEKYCDRRFLQTAYTNEVYDGQGSPQMLLKNYPISTTASFQLDERDTDLNESNWSSVDTKLYHIDYNAGIIELIDDVFREVPRKYQITFTAGYVFKNDAAPLVTLESVGLGDLEYAVWTLINDIYKDAKKVSGVKSESIGNYSVSYGEGGLDKMIQMILDKYKRPHLM